MSEISVITFILSESNLAFSVLQYHGTTIISFGAMACDSDMKLLDRIYFKHNTWARDVLYKYNVIVYTVYNGHFIQWIHGCL